MNLAHTFADVAEAVAHQQMLAVGLVVAVVALQHGPRLLLLTLVVLQPQVLVQLLSVACDQEERG